MAVETFMETRLRKTAKENEQCSREWATFPAWDDMTDEQKEHATALAERQGKRLRTIARQYEGEIHGS